MQFSIRNVRQKKEMKKKKTLQNVYANAKQNVDLDPNNAMLMLLIRPRKILNYFMKKKSTEL